MLPAQSILYPGPFDSNFINLQGIIVDLPVGETRNYRVVQKGFEDVHLELQASLPAAGVASGVSTEIISHYFGCSDNIVKIRAALAVVAKQYEVLSESLAYYEHHRHCDIGVVVDTVRSTARRRRDKGILAPFEKTIKYNGQVGHKAARTRQKNKENAANSPVDQADLKAQLDAYKAELDAKFEAAVKAAVAQALADQPSEPEPEAPQPIAAE